METIQFLVERGADLNARDDKGYTPLHRAAYKGRKGAAEYLLQKGLNANIEDKDGLTPLHHTSLSGEDEVVRLLLEYGAEANAQASDDLRTPSHEASSYGHYGTIQILLEGGAQIMAQDLSNRTVLHTARLNAAIPLLVHLYESNKEHDGDITCVPSSEINAVDAYGRTPLEVTDTLDPYMHHHDGRWLAAEAHVNIMDCLGVEELDVGQGQKVCPILEFPVKSVVEGKIPHDEKSPYLNRMQTHVLNFILSKEYSSEEVLPDELEKCLEFVFSSVNWTDRALYIIAEWPRNIKPESRDIWKLVRLIDQDLETFCLELFHSPLGKCDLESEPSQTMINQVKNF